MDQIWVDKGNGGKGHGGKIPLDGVAATPLELLKPMPQPLPLDLGRVNKRNSHHFCRYRCLGATPSRVTPPGPPLGGRGCY